MRDNDTNPEAKIATVIVIANSCSSLPIIPDINSTGINAAIKDSVIEITVNEISGHLTKER
jgi:hypothetical protein